MDGSAETKSMHILVADDHAVNQMVVKHHLERRGHDVTLADNGVQALDRCAERPFDIILMDVQMPEMDGIETCRRIRAGDSPNRDAPIIAVTAGAESSLRRECLEAGMDEVITKPLLFENLADLLDNRGTAYRREREVTAAALSNQVGDEAPLDTALFLQRLDGDRGFARQLIDGFLDQNERLLQQMEESLRAANLESLRASAHTIKGGALNLAAGDLQRAAAALETSADTDPPVLSGLLSDVAREHERLRRFAVQWLQNP